MSRYDLDFSAWFPTLSYRSKSTLRLFCLPYAGGSAMLFRTWTKYLPQEIEVCPIQLPGRGGRILEPSIKQFPSLINEISKAIIPYLDRCFVFFGHSLGSLIAFEVAHQLRYEHVMQPAHLIFSGCAAPCSITQKKTLSTLSDEEIIHELRQLNGTPNELLANKELMTLSLPSVRADFALYESYNHCVRKPFQCPVTVFGGAEDREVDLHQLESWNQETSGPFALYRLPGDHFFLHSEEQRLLKLILQRLNPLLAELLNANQS